MKLGGGVNHAQHCMTPSLAIMHLKDIQAHLEVELLLERWPGRSDHCRILVLLSLLARLALKVLGRLHDVRIGC